MLPIDDTLSGIFLVLFGIGFVFTVVTFLVGVGHLGGLAHGDGLPGMHGHGAAPPVGGHAPPAAPGPAGMPLGEPAAQAHGTPADVSPLNGFTLAAFLIWFGAAGYLAHAVGGWAAALTLAVAGLGGLAAAAAVFLFLVKVIVPGQTVMDPRDYEREGAVARVSVSIPSGGVGEIVYALAGVRRCDAARHADRRGAIPRGEEVVITGFERGVALVQPVRELLDGPEGSRPGAEA